MPTVSLSKCLFVLREGSTFDCSGRCRSSLSLSLGMSHRGTWPGYLDDLNRLTSMRRSRMQNSSNINQTASELSSSSGKLFFFPGRRAQLSMKIRMDAMRLLYSSFAQPRARSLACIAARTYLDDRGRRFGSSRAGDFSS